MSCDMKLYSKFAGNVIDFLNKTAFKKLKFYKMAKETMKVVEAYRVRAIKFVKHFHAAQGCGPREYN